MLIRLSTAIQILGKHKVVTTNQAARAWGKQSPSLSSIHYSEETLRQCAQTNKWGLTDWWLVFAFGLSLRQQWEIRGIDPSHQPCFQGNNMKSFDEKGEKWLDLVFEPAYQLLDFKGQRFYGVDTWLMQEEAIAKLGLKFERADETVVSEVFFSVLLAHNKSLLADWSHWGKSLESNCRVIVGPFSISGLLIGAVQPSFYDEEDPLHLKVCLFRKFDF